VHFEGGLLIVMYKAGLLLLTTGTIGLLVSHHHTFSHRRFKKGH
jgi:hypothetical protein